MYNLQHRPLFQCWHMRHRYRLVESCERFNLQTPYRIDVAQGTAVMCKSNTPTRLRAAYGKRWTG